MFALFGVVCGYATHSLDERKLGEVAVVGPMTPGVAWDRLWEIARNMCRPSDGDREHAQWVMTQANRSFICGSDVIARFPQGTWLLTGGKRASLGGYCNRDHLWTGNLAVAEATPDQLAARPTRYEV
ncbi:hypothetical protein Q5762_18155 [Streptomyces sp. P9(2023)]|uniref:hypothetical protein n=1 Tax=Streptomyces sp. P9(2023) TaxID=3064394 RepID=UPI0028F45555|nr:hypothetical protein [Streptomyces sp. P9(2023)]MDT9690229.1 hypothetical protein [Streptomyces sp. P9(2023)]